MKINKFIWLAFVLAVSFVCILFMIDYQTTNDKLVDSYVKVSNQKTESKSSENKKIKMFSEESSEDGSITVTTTDSGTFGDLAKGSSSEKFISEGDKTTNKKVNDGTYDIDTGADDEVSNSWVKVTTKLPEEEDYTIADVKSDIASGKYTFDDFKYMAAWSNECHDSYLGFYSICCALYNARTDEGYAFVMKSSKYAGTSGNPSERVAIFNGATSYVALANKYKSIDDKGIEDLWLGYQHNLNAVVDVLRNEKGDIVGGSTNWFGMVNNLWIEPSKRVDGSAKNYYAYGKKGPKTQKSIVNVFGTVNDIGKSIHNMGNITSDAVVAYDGKEWQFDTEKLDSTGYVYKAE